MLGDGADGRVNESAAHFIQIGEASHGTLDSQTSGKQNTVAPQSRGRSRVYFLKFEMWPAEHQPGTERRRMVHSRELLPHSSVLRVDLKQEAGHSPPPPDPVDSHVPPTRPEAPRREALLHFVNRPTPGRVPGNEQVLQEGFLDKW